VKEVAQAKGFTMAKLQRAADINLKTIQAIWRNPQHDASLKTIHCKHLTTIPEILGHFYPKYPCTPFMTPVMCHS
jgi:hypothetical protein